MKMMIMMTMMRVESTSKLEKALTIGGFVIGAIIICVIIFLLDRQQVFSILGQKRDNTGRNHG